MTEPIAGMPGNTAPTRRTHPARTAEKSEGDDLCPLALETVEDRAGLAAVAAEWAELHASCPDARFALDPYWCRRMWERQEARGGRRPLVLIGRVGGRCRLVWPLVTYRQRLWRVTQPLSEDLSDYDDVLVAPSPLAENWLRQAWAWMLAVTRPDVVLCRRVPAGSGLDRLIGSPRRHWEKGSASPYVDFRKFPCFDDYLHSLSRKTRSTIRNRRNRLQAFGPLRLEAVGERDRGVELIAWMFRQKHQRLGSRAHSRLEKTTFANFGRDIPFLADVTRKAYLDGRMQVLRLAAGDHTVAVMTGLVSRRTMVGWLYAYAPEYMTGAPGRLLLVEGLAWAQREGIEIVDFLPDVEPFKAEWTEDCHPVRDVRVATTAWGRLLVGWYRSPLRGRLVSLYMRLPRPAQAMIRRLSS